MMKSQIDSAIHTGATQIALDLREVGFMASTGLRVIIEITSLGSFLPIRSELPAPD